MVRMASCNITSAQCDFAAGIAKASTATVFRMQRQTLPEHWWCTEQMLTVPKADGEDQLVENGADAPARLLSLNEQCFIRVGGHIRHAARSQEHHESRVRVRLAVDQGLHLQ